MSLTVVSVSYPLAKVSPDSSGGSEQILSRLDHALVAAGHRSIVVAPMGSIVEGQLRPIPHEAGSLDEAARNRAVTATRAAIEGLRASEQIDLIHLHGIDFPSYLPAPGVPVLATLHLPPDWYPAEALRPTRPDTWLNCVSATQHAACPAGPALVEPIPNGIPVETFAGAYAKRGFALFLGRICPEKGVHLAIKAAALAGVPLLIAGEIYAYEAHRRYFEEMVRPKLGPNCRFLGPVGFRRKRRLLAAARCLLVPSLAAETSSLVAREAAACGTPVVAFPNGALSQTVEHGRTGFLTEGVEQMAEAIGRCAVIDPATCRAVARARFSERQMFEAYLGLYGRLTEARAA